MMVPDRSLDQRRMALIRANDVRCRRAKLKQDLRVARVSVEGILIAPPEFVYTMKVVDLLLAVPRVGRVKVNRWLKHAEVSPSRTVAGLSDRQRSVLLKELGEFRLRAGWRQAA